MHGIAHIMIEYRGVYSRSAHPASLGEGSPDRCDQRRGAAALSVRWRCVHHRDPTPNICQSSTSSRDGSNVSAHLPHINFACGNESLHGLSVRFPCFLRVIEPDILFEGHMVVRELFYHSVLREKHFVAEAGGNSLKRRFLGWEVSISSCSSL